MYCIYSIGDVETDECLYVGSTTDFKRRRREHRRIRRGVGSPIHKYIDSIGGWEKVDMIIEEELDDVSLPELRQIENWYIDKLNPKCNMNRAYQTEEDRREQKREENAKYRVRNKEKIIARNRDYYERNRDKINAKQRERRARQKYNKDE
jgi:hypothetical protein